MKKLLVVLMAIGLLVGCSVKDEDKLTIGIINWADHPALNDAKEGFILGLKELGIDKQINIIDKNAFDESSNADMIISQMVADQVDLIYAIATPAAQAAVNATMDSDIPIIFNAVTDPVLAGLVANPNQPEGRVTGISDIVPINKQLALIKEFLPEVVNVGVIFNTGEDNSWSQIQEIEAVIEDIDLKLIKKGITLSSEIALTTEQIIHDADVLYIITDNMVAKATPQVVSIANTKKVPVFMAEAGQFEHGILASDSISYLNLGKQAANMAKAILIDQKAIAEIPVEISLDTELFVSQAVADFLNIEIPESILARAILK